MRALIIAIDGPSGAGKGTVARTLAARLCYRHIDTGAMYRAVAWKAIHDGLDLQDAEAVARLAGAAVFDLAGRVVIDGHDVTEAIRTPMMDAAAAVVVRVPPATRSPAMPAAPATRNRDRIQTVPAGIANVWLPACGAVAAGSSNRTSGVGLPLGCRK